MAYSKRDGRATAIEVVSAVFESLRMMRKLILVISLSPCLSVFVALSLSLSFSAWVSLTLPPFAPLCYLDDLRAC